MKKKKQRDLPAETGSNWQVLVWGQLIRYLRNYSEENVAVDIQSLLMIIKFIKSCFLSQHRQIKIFPTTQEVSGSNLQLFIKCTDPCSCSSEDEPFNDPVTFSSAPPSGRTSHLLLKPHHGQNFYTAEGNEHGITMSLLIIFICFSSSWQNKNITKQEL